jgi:cystathionine gamma-lyase/cystathionine beta-lyase/cystathionine gamma-lyase/homocysteine desulfhydrase
VRAVFYPGLSDHPQHALAQRQMTGFGSMITLETGSLGNAKRVLKRAQGTLSLGESLGGVETLISHPATMTHAALGEKGRKAIGITDGMVRISVGIEDLDDILADLEYALGGI